MQEAQSKFSVEIEPENAVTVDPLDGNLSPEGTAVLHFRRSSPSAFKGEIYCKVYMLLKKSSLGYIPLFVVNTFFC